MAHFKALPARGTFFRGEGDVIGLCRARGINHKSQSFWFEHSTVTSLGLFGYKARNPSFYLLNFYSSGKGIFLSKLFKMVQNKRWVYKKIPDGLPIPGEHIVVEDSTFDLDAAPPKGGITVKNIYFSLDPYLRPRMRRADIPSSLPAFDTNTTIINYAVSKVLKSDSPKAQPGDIVATLSGGEEYSVLPPELLESYDFFKIPADRDPKLHLTNYISALGMPGRTAWSSLFEIAAPKKGETIWVSSASGSVGSFICQLAKHQGLKVIGSVGNDDKLDFIIKTLGVDAGFNYKKEKPEQAIRRLAPEGIDIYYDNVGAEHFEAALNTIKNFGRIGTLSAIFLFQKGVYPADNTVQSRVATPQSTAFLLQSAIQSAIRSRFYKSA